MKIFQSRLEKDFENFVRGLPKLEPIEFLGLAKILGIKTHEDLEVLGIAPTALKDMDADGLKDIGEKLTVPFDSILEQMMDKFLALSKQRRKEILQIIKDVKMEKRNQEVKKNGSST